MEYRDSARVRELLAQGVLLFDGATGTALCAQSGEGEAVERLCLTQPQRVLALHRAKDAGVVRLKVDVAPAPVALSRLRGAARAEAEAAAENYENVRSAYEREVAAALRIPVQVLNTVDDEDRVLGWLAATVRTAWRSHLRPRLAERIRHQLLDAAAQHAGAHGQKRPPEQRQKRDPDRFLIMQEPFLYFPHVSSPHLSYFRSDFVYMRQNITCFSINVNQRTAKDIIQLLHTR